MVNYKISVISYLNSIPFVYGLNSSTISKSLNLQLDYPSVCADKLIDNVVDIGLVPVVVLKDYPSFKIISEYCIDASMVMLILYVYFLMCQFKIFKKYI